MLITCDRCRGLGISRGLGLIETECLKCHGKRFVEQVEKPLLITHPKFDGDDLIAEKKEKEALESVNEVASNIVSDMRANRGRKPKSFNA